MPKELALTGQTLLFTMICISKRSVKYGVLELQWC